MDPIDNTFEIGIVVFVIAWAVLTLISPAIGGAVAAAILLGLFLFHVFSRPSTH